MEEFCARCRELIVGESVPGWVVNRPVVRCVKCDTELKDNAKRRLESREIQPIEVAPGHSECKATMHSFCMVCKGRVYKNTRMVWRRGTRITYHPRCWRMVGQFSQNKS